MKWIAIAVLCFASQVARPADYYAASGGLFTNVFPGVTANDTIWITNASYVVSNTASSQTFSNLYLLEGALRFGNFPPTVRGTWVVSNGWVSHYFGGSAMLGGTVSNLQIVGSGGFSNELYLGLLNTTAELPSGFYNGFKSFVYPSAGTMTITGVNATNISVSLRFLHNASAVVSNSAIHFAEFGITSSQTNSNIRWVNSSFTIGGSPANTVGSNCSYSLIGSTGLISSSDVVFRNVAAFLTNSTLSITGVTTRVFNSSGTQYQFDNSRMVFRQSATLTPSTGSMPPLEFRTAPAGVFLAAALTAPTVLSSNTWHTQGNTVTVGTFTNYSSVVASNSSIYATNMFSAGSITPGTSTIYLQGGTSSITNYYSLVPVGSCALTGAAISVTGTLAGQVGASIDAAGGTLTLSNNGLLQGPAYNTAVATNSRPLTVYRGGTNTTGNLWPWPRSAF